MGLSRPSNKDLPGLDLVISPCNAKYPLSLERVTDLKEGMFMEGIAPPLWLNESPIQEFAGEVSQMERERHLVQIGKTRTRDRKMGFHITSFLYFFLCERINATQHHALPA